MFAVESTSTRVEPCVVLHRLASDTRRAVQDGDGTLTIAQLRLVLQGRGEALMDDDADDFVDFAIKECDPEKKGIVPAEGPSESEAAASRLGVFNLSKSEELLLLPRLSTSSVQCIRIGGATSPSKLLDFESSVHRTETGNARSLKNSIRDHPTHHPRDF